jgi:hypothetical protein
MFKLWDNVRRSRCWLDTDCRVGKEWPVVVKRFSSVPIPPRSVVRYVLGFTSPACGREQKEFKDSKLRFR